MLRVGLCFEEKIAAEKEARFVESKIVAEEMRLVESKIAAGIERIPAPHYFHYFAEKVLLMDRSTLQDLMSPRVQQMCRSSSTETQPGLVGVAS